MKQTLLITLCLIFFANAHSQGITLLFKGGGSGGWNDPVNWIQIDIPVGQVPIQRAPTELDDVVISNSLSGLSRADFSFDSALNVGGGSSTGYSCRSMHVSNTLLSFDNPRIVDGANTINVYTSIGGFVLLMYQGGLLPAKVYFPAHNTFIFHFCCHRKTQ